MVACNINIDKDPRGFSLFTPNDVNNMKPKVLYVLGAGHSGSTILDIVLGNHSNIESVGELRKLHHSGWRPNQSRRCACGSLVHECPYWSKIYELWRKKVGEDGINAYILLQQEFEGSRKHWSSILLKSKYRSARFEKYARMTSILYAAIQSVSGKSIIVDSSKIPLRAYTLWAGDMVELYILHLIRDGRGVVWSLEKSYKKDIRGGVPKDRKPAPAWRTTFNWIITNLESEWVVSKLRTNKVLRVSYESFVEKPDEILTSIGVLVGENMRDVSHNLRHDQIMKIGHNVGGNRIRMDGHVTLNPDYEWMRKLPYDKKIAFLRLAGWLAKRYGYKGI